MERKGSIGMEFTLLERKYDPIVFLSSKMTCGGLAGVSGARQTLP